MIWVLLQAESRWQRNDAITFFNLSLCFFDANSIIYLNEHVHMKLENNARGHVSEYTELFILLTSIWTQYWPNVFGGFRQFNTRKNCTYLSTPSVKQVSLI